MPTIIHLSDLHFGTEVSQLVESTIIQLKQINPDIIIISGDLTQRAKTSQFKRINEFLQKLNHQNILCVPGNHDIPLYRIIERFFFTYSKYKKYIHPLLNPTYRNQEMAIYGLNSVTPYKPMGGFVTKQELQRVKKFFNNCPDSQFKIIVMHHNLIRSQRHDIINDAEKIINTFAACGVNLVLSGHIHFSYVEQLKRSFISHNMYVVTAGTATSTRTLAPNSFNVIRLDPVKKEIKVEIYEFHHTQFIKTKEHNLVW